MATFSSILTLLLVTLSALLLVEARHMTTSDEESLNFILDPKSSDDRVTDKSCKQQHSGCTVRENSCKCDVIRACKNPWPYHTELECEEDLKGTLDICKHHHPCGKGMCVQVKDGDGERKAKCDCTGSGFHGKSCEHKCPPAVGELAPKYPEACLKP